jgi:hypothetical protein
LEGGGWTKDGLERELGKRTAEHGYGKGAGEKKGRQQQRLSTRKAFGDGKGPTTRRYGGDGVKYQTCWPNLG